VIERLAVGLRGHPFRIAGLVLLVVLTVVAPLVTIGLALWGTLSWLVARRLSRHAGKVTPGRVAISAASVLLGVLVLIQAVPYGRTHDNPPVSAEPDWNSPRTRELAVVACYDCHSNETRWPWYTNVAPLSWSITSHVDEGREKLNFSEWDRPQDEGDEVVESITEGEMPPVSYVWLHPEARLSDEDEAALIEGLEETLRRSPPQR